MECTRETCPAAESPSLGGRAKKLGRFLLGFVGPISAGYDVLRILLAGLLLTAAGLKAYQLSTEPTFGTGLLDSRWLLIATVEFELLFGLWLLANILPKPTWAVAIGCFGLFTCISLYKALSGHASCGCFGRIEVNPWYTASLDLTIVLSLLCWRPKSLPSPACGRGAGGEGCLEREGLSVMSPLPSGEGKGGGCLKSEGLSAAFRVPSFITSRVPAVLLLWFFLGLPVVFAMGSHTDTTLSDAGAIIGDGKVIVLKPEKWIGKQFPLLDYINIGDKLKEGKWSVLIYRNDCPNCQAILSRGARSC